MNYRNIAYTLVYRSMATLLIGWAALHLGMCRALASQAAHSYIAVTVPFTAPQEDRFYRPHQLITVGVQKDAMLAASRATFLFDTGSNISSISATFARKLGGDKIPFMGRMGQQSPQQDAPVWVQAPSIQVGDLKIKHMLLRVLPDEQLRVASGHKVDGILGADFCQSFVVHLDFTRSQITFIVPSQTLTYSTPISAPVLLSPEEIARQGFSGAQVVSLIHFNGLFWTSAHLHDQRRVADDLLLIDSGSDTTFLSEQSVQKLNLLSVSSQNHAEPLPVLSNWNHANLTGEFIASAGWVPGLQCGGLRLDDMLVLWPSVPQADFKAILGLDALANYDVLLDFPHQKMYLRTRSDLQAITSHQYESASAVQRQQWAQGRPIIIYPTNNRLDSLAVSYDLNAAGLPITQVRSAVGETPASFLLKTSLSDSYLTEPLAKKWGLVQRPGVMSDGTPLTMEGHPLSEVVVPNLRVGGLLLTSSSMVVLSPVQSLRAASGLSVAGAMGANALLQGPLLMDPQTQTWMLFIANMSMGPDDLKSVEMADASALDILTSNNDGIPSFAVEVRKGTQRHKETLEMATGSPFTLLSAKAAQTLKLTPEPQKLRYGPAADVTVFNQAHVSQLCVGDVVLENVLIAYPDGAMPTDFSPHLGMDVISRLRLLVDMPGKKLYVKKAEK